MKRKNTEASVGVLVYTGLLITIMLLLAGAVLTGLFRGTFKLIDPSQSLPRQLLRLLLALGGSGLLFKGIASFLWLWWTELRNTARSARAGVKRWWKKPLTVLLFYGLIVSAPFWLLPILFMAEGPEEWMLLYALYLFFAGLVTILPCALIYGLGKSLAEKETEKEELDEAKKY